MPKLLTLIVITLACASFYPRSAAALGFSAPNAKFGYTDTSGKKQSVEVVDKYYPKKIVKPFPKADAQIDPKLRRAATIAEKRAAGHVEIRTETGFVSDFRSKIPPRRPLLGVFAKT